jgi:hypothetical protein
MLMQNFKSAADLGLTERQKAALMKTLVLLETGKLQHVRPSDQSTGDYRQDGKFTGHFNMGRWRAVEDCGTVCCIAGTSELIGGVIFPTENYGKNHALKRLFWVNGFFGNDLSLITPAQAATALRSYLTTGEARWDLALAL